MLKPFGVSIVSAGQLGLPVPDETGTTFEENAKLKALAATRGSGLPALADDSGLSVQALGGAPGVYTADWEGPTRDAMVGMQRIQDEFAKRRVPDTDTARTATFHCVLALAWPDEHVELFHGTLDGRIVWPPRGLGGHGYDPCFQPQGDIRTTAQMTDEEKKRHQPSRPCLPFDGRGLLPMTEPLASTSIGLSASRSVPTATSTVMCATASSRCAGAEPCSPNSSMPHARRRGGRSRRCSSAAARRP